MVERIDNSRRAGRTRVRRWSGAVLLVLLAGACCSAALGQGKKTVQFLPLKGATAVQTGAASPAAVRALAAKAGKSPAAAAADTAPLPSGAYYLGTQVVNATATAQNLSFTTTSSAASYTPTASLRFGKSYSVGAISCTGTYDAGNADYDQTCSVPLTFAPLYPGGHRDAIFINDPDGGQIGAAFVYGIGQGPQLMIQPGVSTGVSLPTTGYMYGTTIDDAGTFYVFANNSFYTIRGGVAALLVSSVGRGQGGLSIDGAGNLFDPGSGGNSGYEYGTAGEGSEDATLCHTIGGYMVGPIVYLPFTVCFYSPATVATGNLGTYYEADYGGESENVSGNSKYGPGLVSQSYEPQGPVISPGQVGNAGSWGDGPLPYPYNGGSYSPSEMAVDAYENLFFADANGTTRWCDWGGITGSANGCGSSSGMTQVNQISPSGSFSLDAADTLYESTSNGIEMLPASNTYSAMLTTIGVSGYANSNVVGPDGTIFVYSPLNDVVYLFDRSQGAIDFGSNNGVTANPYTVTVYNGGNEPLTLGTISLVGATGYTLASSGTNLCSNGLTVAVGAVCLIQVKSSPTHPGVLNGGILITSNTLNQQNVEQEVTLTGYTSGIYVTASPNPLAFGLVGPGETSTLPVSVINTSAGSTSIGYGSSTVVNSGFTSSNAAFSATIGTCNAQEPSGGPNCAINVTFKPSLAQTYTGTITWQEAIPGGPTQAMSLAVSGMGTPPAVPFADLEAMTVSDAISLVPSTLLSVNEGLMVSDGVPMTTPSTILNVGEGLNFSDTDDVNGGTSSDATTTVLATSTNVAGAGGMVTLSATVAQMGSGAAAAGGVVNFVEDGNAIGNAMLSAGVGSIVSPPLTLGSHTFQASYAGNGTLSGSASNVVTVNVVAQSVLLVTASDVSRSFGAANPEFGYLITNTSGGALPAVTGAPVLTTTATMNSLAGNYAIVPALGTLQAPAGYAFGFANGMLTVQGGVAQSIHFARVPNLPAGISAITLTAHSTSGLPITYTVAGPASVSGEVLTINGVGTVTVTAMQGGSPTFAAATPVSRSFEVGQ